jgi:hypothetical protein
MRELIKVISSGKNGSDICGITEILQLFGINIKSETLIHENRPKVSPKPTSSIGCAKINIHPMVIEVSCSDLVSGKG